MTPKELGLQIMVHRKRKGQGQKAVLMELAKCHCAMSKSKYSAIENGRTVPNVIEMQALRTILDIKEVA